MRAKAVAAEQPYADHLDGWQGPWNFAGAEETAERLERAGFVEIETWLEPYPITPPDPSGYLRTVCLGHHLEQLPEELQGVLRGGRARALRHRARLRSAQYSGENRLLTVAKPGRMLRFRARWNGWVLTSVSPGVRLCPWQGCQSAFSSRTTRI